MSQDGRTFNHYSDSPIIEFHEIDDHVGTDNVYCPVMISLAWPKCLWLLSVVGMLSSGLGTLSSAVN